MKKIRHCEERSDEAIYYRLLRRWEALLAMTSFLLFFISGISFANPPTSINLTYDPAKENLHVEAAHESSNLEKSYVRLMNVFINGQQVASQNYYKQDDYDKFTDDVSVTAQPGDVIKVDLFCAEGGELAQELKVTNGVSETQAPSPDASGDTNAEDNTSN